LSKNITNYFFLNFVKVGQDPLCSNHSEGFVRQMSCSGSKGLTLIEVLIALAIIGIMLPAVVGMLVAGSGYIIEAGEKTTGVQLADEKIQDIKGRSYPCLEKDGYTELGGITESYGDIDGFAEFRRITEVTIEELPLTETESIEIMRLRVRVFWNGEEDPYLERSLKQELLRAETGF